MQSDKSLKFLLMHSPCEHADVNKIKENRLKSNHRTSKGQESKVNGQTSYIQ